jgi:hypothetical protein
MEMGTVSCWYIKKKAFLLYKENSGIFGYQESFA